MSRNIERGTAMKVLVTGAEGFVGRNLIATLKTMPNIELYSFDRNNKEEDLERFTQDCQFVFHLAGVNRPQDTREFMEGNATLTDRLCQLLSFNQNKSPIVMTSSIQAILNNDYGMSKKAGEEALRKHGELNESPVYVYRLANLFGKWSRPNYNTVVATWCHNVAHDIEITISNPAHVIEFCYIDDVVTEFLNALMGSPTCKDDYCVVNPTYNVSLGELAEMIQSFKSSRTTLLLPKTGDAFVAKLYATYLSFLKEDDFSYLLKMNVDQRGSFTEFVKTEMYGQVSVNISKPGITKGNHWHHTKNEKFLVVSGKGAIRFRNIFTDQVIEYFVTGEKLEVVDIPTGYTHNIENLGETDMVTVMWASEAFDPERPDTYYLEV